MRHVIPINSGSGDAGNLGEDLRSRLRLGEKTVQLFAALAEESMAERKWSEAAAMWEQLLELDPQSADAWGGLGEARFQLGACAEALRAFDECLRLMPSDEAALQGKAEALAELERDSVDSMLSLWQSTTVQSLGALARAQSTGPPPQQPWPEASRDRSDILSMVEAAMAPLEEGLAAAALGVGDWRSVVKHCRRLVEARPDHFEAWYNLGVAHQQSGEAEEAEHAYRQALKAKPDSADALLNLGMTLQMQNDAAGAREQYELLIQISPDCVPALWNLGLLLEETGEQEAASQQYERIAKTDPAHAEAWFRLGFARLRQGEWEHAAAALERFQEATPDSWEGALNLAIAYQRLGRYREAMTLFERVLAEQPDNGVALQGLGLAAAGVGQIEVVVGVRKKLAQAKQPTAGLTFQVARWLEEKGRREDAIRVYCDALKEQPMFPEALLNLGHLLAGDGKAAEASECWRRALSLRPELAADYFDPKD
ncbi:MAG: tetratricopeptide repeat protein [Acidobacteriota bacterium]